MKQVKQIVKSKRVGFTALLNVGWLATTLSQLDVIRSSTESLTDGFPYSTYIGVTIAFLATIGVVWTKLYDDGEAE